MEEAQDNSVSIYLERHHTIIMLMGYSIFIWMLAATESLMEDTIKVTTGILSH